jgi:hypothetical protein
MKTPMEREDGTKIPAILPRYDITKVTDWSSTVDYKTEAIVKQEINSVTKYYSCIKEHKNQNPANDVNQDYWVLTSSPRISLASINEIFQERECLKHTYAVYGGLDRKINLKYYPLGMLYTMCELVLFAAQEAFNELTGESFELNLLPSEIGFETCPVEYKMKPYVSGSGSRLSLDNDTPVYDFITAKKPLRMDNAYSSDYYVPYVHRSVLDDRLCPDGDSQYSIRKYDSVIEALGAIAKSFGLYPKVTPKTTKIIDIEFMSKSAVTAEAIYIADWVDGKKEADVATSDETVIYKGFANGNATDGLDEPLWADKEGDYLVATPSESIKKLGEKKKSDSDDGEEKLLLTSSYPIIKFWQMVMGVSTGRAVIMKNGQSSLPFNVTPSASDNFEGALKGYDIYPQKESSLTSIFVRTAPLSADQISHLATTPVWRPIAKVFAEQEGEPMKDESGAEGVLLSKYVDNVNGKTKDTYTDTYEIKIPFWSAFSPNADGSSPTWKTLKLGSKITFTESNRKVWNATLQQWENVSDVKDYIVKGIERDTDQPSTTIKLEAQSKYAITPQADQPNYGLYYGGTSEEETAPAQNAGETVIVSEIEPWNHVMLDGDGNFVKSVNHSSFFGKYEGIAIVDSFTDEIVKVQKEGTVESSSYSFSGPGKQVYVRINNEGLNISETLLTPAEAKTSMNDAGLVDENAIVVIGVTKSTNSFEIMNPPKLTYYAQGIIDNA